MISGGSVYATERRLEVLEAKFATFFYRYDYHCPVKEGNNMLKRISTSEIKLNVDNESRCDDGKDPREGSPKLLWVKVKCGKIEEYVLYQGLECTLTCKSNKDGYYIQDEGFGCLRSSW